jgi:hypothetical protein
MSQSFKPYSQPTQGGLYYDNYKPKGIVSSSLSMSSSSHNSNLKPNVVNNPTEYDLFNKIINANN